jgi:hypothetical protein
MSRFRSAIAVKPEENAMIQTLNSQPAVHVADELGERCDRCGAAAKLRATITGTGSLAFCGHHANRYADRISVTAERIDVESGFAWRGAEYDLV